MPQAVGSQESLPPGNQGLRLAELGIHRRGFARAAGAGEPLS